MTRKFSRWLLDKLLAREGWSMEDIEELDRKFDALCEFLEVEFVFEKISNGSDWADQTRLYARKKGEKTI